MEMGVSGWLVLELTNSPWQLALVGVFRSAPLLAFGLFAGLIADRMSRQRIMMVAQTVSSLVAATLLLLVVSAAIQPWHIFLGTFLLGVNNILEIPSRRSLIYDMVGPQHVVSAMSLETISNTLGKFAGPLLAGLFIELTGFQGVYMLLLLAYVVSLLLISQVREKLTRPLALAQPIWQSLVSGIRYAIQNRFVAAVLGITIIMNALAFSYVQLLPVIARDHLQVGPGLMGVLASADGIGTFIGAMLMAMLGNLRLHGRIFVLGSLLELVSLVAFALSPNYLLSFALLLLVGMGNAGFSTMQSTIILLSSTPGMRGRALGVLGLCIGATPLGLLELGAMAEVFGARAAIALNAVVGFCLLLPLLISTPVLSGTPTPGTDMDDSQTTKPGDR
jgi:MFS family permease